MGMLKEFKEFAMRGNVVDMAVGIVIGGAFGKIVSSLVGDVIMPPIGLLMSNIDLSKWALTLKDKSADSDAVVVRVGTFLNSVIDFAIMALAIFLVVKAMNALRRKKDAAPPPPPESTKEEILLTEIRDLLKARG